MDTILSVIFLFLFLIIAGIVIYVLLDYVQYKSDMDESLVSVDKKIEKNKSKFVSTSRYANDKSVNEKQLSELTKKDTAFEANIEDMKTMVGKNQDNIVNFDSALNNYFTFVDDGKEIKDKKIFDYVFTGVNDSIITKKRVDVLNGINLTASSDKPVQICDKDHNCINVHVDNENHEFNIEPGSGEIQGMTIKSSDGDVMTKYNTKDNTTFFGGSDQNESAMYIQDGKMYVNNINFNIRNEDDQIQTQINMDGKQIGNGFNLLQKYSNQIQPIFQNFIINNKENIENVAKSIDELAFNMITEVQVHYHLNNTYNYETESGDVYTPTYTYQALTLKLLSKYSFDEGDIISIVLPSSDVGRFTSSGRADPSTAHTDGLNIGKYYIESDLPVNKSLSRVDLNRNVVIVSISSHVDANTQIELEIRGKNIFENRSTMHTYGITIGTLFSKKWEGWKFPSMESVIPSPEIVKNYNKFKLEYDMGDIYDK